jgi:hypothetical protein
LIELKGKIASEQFRGSCRKERHSNIEIGDHTGL